MCNAYLLFDDMSNKILCDACLCWLREWQFNYEFFKLIKCTMVISCWHSNFDSRTFIYYYFFLSRPLNIRPTGRLIRIGCCIGLLWGRPSQSSLLHSQRQGSNSGRCLRDLAPHPARPTGSWFKDLYFDELKIQNKTVDFLK